MSFTDLINQLQRESSQTVTLAAKVAILANQLVSISVEQLPHALARLQDELGDLELAIKRVSTTIHDGQQQLGHQSFTVVIPTISPLNQGGLRGVDTSPPLIHTGSAWNLSPLFQKINPTILAEALNHYDADDLNEFMVTFEEAIEEEFPSEKEAIQEAELLLTDMIKAKDVPGIHFLLDQSPLDILADEEVYERRWNGARFELRYAARHAHEIEEISCSNWIDVKMKDGSYRELKSYTHYDQNALDKVLEQLKKHVTDRGAKNITVVFEGKLPQSSFKKKLQAGIDKLKNDYMVEIDYEEFL